MSPEVQQKDDRSLGELFAELTRETTQLFRQELALARAELSQKASQVGKNVGRLAVGGAIAYLGMFGILLGLIYLLAEAGLPLWASALLVGAIVSAIGGFLVANGLKSLRQVDMAPRQTLETLEQLKEDIR